MDCRPEPPVRSGSAHETHVKSTLNTQKAPPEAVKWNGGPRGAVLRLSSCTNHHLQPLESSVTCRFD